jgi:hypothetical protein
MKREHQADVPFSASGMKDPVQIMAHGVLICLVRQDFINKFMCDFMMRVEQRHGSSAIIIGITVLEKIIVNDLHRTRQRFAAVIRIER